MKTILKKMRTLYPPLFKTSGAVELTTGSYELFIDAFIDEDDEIVFEIDTYNHTTCSYLSGDQFFVKVKEKGFFLKADIESEKVKFIWKIK